MVAQELSEKLERPFEFSFSRTMAADIVGKSRAFSALVRTRRISQKGVGGNWLA